MPPRKPSPIGVHVPVAAGLATGGLGYARDVGAEAVQVYVSNPRGWAAGGGDPVQDAAFRARCAETGTPAFVHAPHLVNFGSPTATTVENSVRSLRHMLRRAREIGARGVVVHTGSAVARDHRDQALKQVREALLPLLEEIPTDGPDLLLEPSAGQGESLCSTVGDLGPYLEALDAHPRVGVCLDTCHAFAAGHDLAVPGGLKRTLDALVRTVGRGRLKLVHANDSRDVLGSGRDRHAGIGKGHIGAAPFAELFRHPATRGVPVVAETSGGPAEHRRDIETLKALRDS